MSHPPRVSVVIPCWNAEATMAEAIDSALAQTCGDLEVIVVDDGSTDTSLGTIKSYGERIRWETGPNRGGSAARNRGLALARGERVLFLDADDVLYPTMLERLLAVAAEHSGSVPICDREDVGEAAAPSVVPYRNRYDGRDPLIFFIESSPQTSALLHRRSDLEAIGGFDASRPCCQERDLHLRLAARGMTLVAVPEILFRVRRREGSVSASYRKVLCERVRIHIALHHELTRLCQLTPERRMALARVLSRDGRHLVRAGEPELADTAFRVAAGLVRDGDLVAFRHPLLRSAASWLGAARTEALMRRASLLQH